MNLVPSFLLSLPFCFPSLLSLCFSVYSPSLFDGFCLTSTSRYSLKAKPSLHSLPTTSDLFSLMRQTGKEAVPSRRISWKKAMLSQVLGLLILHSREIVLYKLGFSGKTCDWPADSWQKKLIECLTFMAGYRKCPWVSDRIFLDDLTYAELCGNWIENFYPFIWESGLHEFSFYGICFLHFLFLPLTLYIYFTWLYQITYFCPLCLGWCYWRWFRHMSVTLISPLTKHAAEN